MRTHKECNSCEQLKEISQFYKHKRSADGLKYDCKDCEIKKQKETYTKNPDSRKKTLERNKRWKEKNPEKYAEARKKIEEKRKEKRREYHKLLRRKLRKNPINRLKNNVSRQVSHGIKRSSASKHGQPVFDALEYSPEQLKEHLEKQFDDNMNWENYGSYWHIDHIIPHSSFSYSSTEDEQFKKCWSLDNLRPLEAIENIRKGDKLV